MKDLRIVFMGTPDFAVDVLKAMVEAKYEIAGVVTAPDKPAGRGRRLQESAVKKYAVAQGLQVLQPINLKANSFLDELRALQANLQVVVAFRMLPEMVWKMPSLGTFNLHASLLPQYRGAAPINWAIINGETKTGVSTFFLDDKIDTGPMILQEEVKIEAHENAGSLHDKLMHKGAELVLKTLAAIKSNSISPVEQDHSAALKTAYKFNRENTRIDWEQPLEKIYNFVRGLSPFPTAWTHLLNGEEPILLKIYEADVELSQHEFATGRIILEGKKLKVAAKDGFLILEEIQLPGKRKMPVKDLLNGYKFLPEAKLE